MRSGGFENNRKRPRDADFFNVSNNNFNMPQKDFDEFRPVKVIDYQNKTQNQQCFNSLSPFSGANMMRSEDIFPRKVIEYDHKTKVHPWNWFCPVLQFDYNHTKTAISLHEHPPPKPIQKQLEAPHRVKPELKEEHMHFRQSKWMQSERQERFQHGGQSERHYQSKFENRATPPLNSNENQSYYRRNPQERNWSRNFRDWNSSPVNYGTER